MNKKTQNRISQIVSEDKPLTDPRSDRLGYTPFAQNLARVITSQRRSEGWVLAVYGPWGSGKTTMANFAVQFLQQGPEETRPLVFRFNPWWFSGHEDLARRFLEQFEAAIRGNKHLAKSVKKAFGKLTEVLTYIPATLTLGPIGLTLPGRREPEDLSVVKESVAEALRASGKQIVVTIDDIDRLTAEEIRQLFKVVKALADFPNVVYLLLFDKNIVSKALSSVQDIDGDDYLEKIVQVQFDLPPPDSTSLRALFTEKLDSILSETPDGLFDSTYWGNVFFDGIAPFLTSPRRIVRLTNVLSATYPTVVGEVNPVDFVAISALQVFCPEVYQIVRSNPGLFAGHTNDGSLSFREEGIKKFHLGWYESLVCDSEAEKVAVRDLLVRLFPRLGNVWSNTIWGPSWQSNWRRSRRICSSDVFPIYFRLALPAGQPSHSEISAILKLAENRAAFGERLVQLSKETRPDGTSRARAMLDYLMDYVDEVPSEVIPTIVFALTDVGDDLLLPSDENRGMFDWSNDLRISRLIYHLLKRLPEPERHAVLEEAVRHGKAVATLENQVVLLGQQHGRWGASDRDNESDCHITELHLNALENLTLERIRESVSAGELIESPRLVSLLHRWKAWGDEREVRDWIERLLICDEAKLVRFLEAFITRSHSHSITDRVSKETIRLEPSDLEQFTDPTVLVGPVQRMLDSGVVTGDTALAFRYFLESWRARMSGITSPDIQQLP